MLPDLDPEAKVRLLVVIDETATVLLVVAPLGTSTVIQKYPVVLKVILCDNPVKE